jgi:NACalpha-BTF3-like transcription factor
MQAMGFPASKAREALAETGDDLAAATEWLCSACL